ncbi:MAG: ABC transporter permease [Planctomycetales bacterium]|nr:ABC transporter permease [Planctomycetales bacterium]
MSVNAWQSVGMQARREVLRFVRQRSRVTGAALQPLMFWLLFGLGLRGSFRPGGESGGSYMEYFFPGTVVLVLLFTAIFATISIIEDRREGFLQSVLVSPTPRWQMVFGKVLGGAAIAVVQALLIVLLGMVVYSESAVWSGLPALVVLLTLGALALTSLGFVIAWRMESTAGFHAIMNLFLMPMWLLSGAFFPIPPLASGQGWTEVAIHWLMRLNPLTYCVAGVRQLMSASREWPGIWTPSLGVCWLVTLLFAAVVFGAACRTARVRIQGDLL